MTTEGSDTNLNDKLSFIFACVGAVIGFFSCSDPWTRAFISAAFNIGYNTVPIVGVITGGIIGFFVIEIFALAAFIAVAIAVTLWLK